MDLLKNINPDVLLSDLRDLPPGLNYLVLFVKRKKFACFLNPAISNNNWKETAFIVMFMDPFFYNHPLQL